MYPTVLGYDAFPLMRLVATALASILTVRALRRAGHPWSRLVLAQSVLVAAGLSGAKLYSLVEWGQVGMLPAAAWNPNGYRYPGGLLAVLLVVPLVMRLYGSGMTGWRFGDLLAPSIAVAMGIARLGCFLHGCCYGRVSWLPWAVRFPAHSQAWTEHVQAGMLSPSALASLPVHPLQLYFLTWSLLVAVWLQRRARRPHRDGDILLAFLVAHEGGKALLEWFRAPAPLPHLVLISASLAVLGGAVWAVRISARRAEASAEAAPVPGRADDVPADRGLPA